MRHGGQPMSESIPDDIAGVAGSGVPGAAIDHPVVRIQPSRGWVSLGLREVWEYRELLYFITWRDIKVRYQQTIFGASWAVIQPFFTMVVFSVFFAGRYDQYRKAEWTRIFRYSYTFAHSHSHWGWATWKRAWKHHDMEMKPWPGLRDSSRLLDMFEDQRVADFWTRTFDEFHTMGLEAHTWDYQWTFMSFARRGLAIIPSTHLVSNVGFGEDATHTRRRDPARERGALLGSDMEFPLVHPPAVVRDVEFDRLVSAALVAMDRTRNPGWRRKMARRVRGAVSRMLTVLQ
jgi:hypothetical protein